MKYQNVSNVSNFKFLTTKKIVQPDWLFVRSKVVFGMTNDLLILDKNYLQACLHILIKIELKCT